MFRREFEELALGFSGKNKKERSLQKRYKSK